MSSLLLFYMIGLMFLGSFALYRMALVVEHVRLFSRSRAPASPRRKPYRLEADPRYHRFIPSAVKAGATPR